MTTHDTSQRLPAEPSDGGDASPAELDAYLADMARFKTRRMMGLGALCGLLLIPLVIIYAKSWWNVDPAHPVGRGWVFVGIAVTLCALGAVLADVRYRREL